MLAETKALGILEFSELKRSNNTSGAPGVTFSKSARQPEGMWQARLKLDGGKTATKSFSVRRHGAQGPSHSQSPRGVKCWWLHRIDHSCTIRWRSE